MTEDLEGTPYLPSDAVVSTEPVQTHLDLPAHLDKRYCAEKDTFFTDHRAHLELHAEDGTPCKELGIGYAKYMGTYETTEEGTRVREAARPPEDIALRGWTAQQRKHQ